MIKIVKRTSRRGTSRYTALYSAEDGWRSAGTFGDRRVAESKARVEEDKASKSEWTDPKSGKVTLTGYAEGVWLPSLTVEVSTRAGYTYIWTSALKPRFGEMAIASILTSTIKKWIAEMEKAEVGRSTAAANYRILRLILNCAKRDRVIASNPAEMVRPLHVPEHEILIYTEEQWEAFYAEADSYWKPIFGVARMTGMRASEVRGLTPSQIQWIKRELTVDRSIVQVQPQYNDGSNWAYKDYPKGKHPRKVPLTLECMNLLADQIKAQGIDIDSTDTVFPLFDSSMASAAMKETALLADVPRRRMHDLRSTYASWRLKETNGDLSRVQKELGHANVQTTAKYLTVVEDTTTIEDQRAAYAAFLESRQG